jgi:multidrug efflux system membrane fusion protein
MTRPGRRRARQAFSLAIALAILVLGVYALWPRTGSARVSPASGPTSVAKNSPRRAAAGPATPVVAVRAHRGNIGVYFTGLGAVTPIYTVTVKSRVDGELFNVYYKEGDLVHQGDLLVQIDPRPYEAALTQAQGQLLRDKAALENARIDLARYQLLVPQKAVPEQQLATQQATVSQDEGNVKFDEGSVAAAQTNLAYTKITAPITGLIGLRLVDPGNIVHASDTNGLLVITQIDPISVIFTISEDQLPAVLARKRAGQTLDVDAYSRDLTKELARGTLTTIDNQIDQSTGTVRIRATFDNKNFVLFPNQFVNARLLVQEKRGVVILPTAAIQRTSDYTYVFLVRPDSTVTIRKITVGTTEGENSEITSGLKAGDEVVMTGVDKLQEGSRVQAQITGEAPPPGNGETVAGAGGKANRK